MFAFPFHEISAAEWVHLVDGPHCIAFRLYHYLLFERVRHWNYLDWLDHS